MINRNIKTFSCVQGPNKGGLGVTNLHVRYPVTSSTCSSMYGELYVYMACTRSCQDATCPLKAVEQDSCVNVPYSEKVYTLTQVFRGGGVEMGDLSSIEL